MALASQFGIVKRKRLKPGAIPTISLKPFSQSSSACSIVNADHESYSSPRKKTAQAAFGEPSTAARGATKRERGKRYDIHNNTF